MMQDEVVVKNGMTKNFRLVRSYQFDSGSQQQPKWQFTLVRKEQAGKDFIVAGLCFIVPAVLLTGFFAYGYKEYGQLPSYNLLYGTNQQ
jgi:chromate transporter